jgi:hypothetical protein
VGLAELGSKKKGWIMRPQAFTNLMDSCNESILALESCIAAADTCEDVCEKLDTCPVGAQEFIAKAQNTIGACQECIKVCDEMIVQFKVEGHDEHMEAIDKAVKILGECVRSLRANIDTCSLVEGCRTACQDARHACEEALIAVMSVLNHVKSMKCFIIT